jgi:hypothetical protein
MTIAGTEQGTYFTEGALAFIYEKSKRPNQEISSLPIP